MKMINILCGWYSVVIILMLLILLVTGKEREIIKIVSVILFSPVLYYLMLTLR